MIVGFKNGRLYVKVTAQPRKGEANRALLELVAQTLAVPRDALDLVRGHTSRNKIIAFRGLSAEELQRRLALAEKDLFQR